MADTVPVRDVLSEAMEYLSKLGSNLRVRSENLKEKRLRKDKLRNSHAVKKIVSKVLLICELSKKSIENVETGVKKILSQIVATQASGSDGGKITSHKSSIVDSEIKYEYFNYKSRKLKIRNKVNLKHFTSVKVVVKAMSTELLEKHSVFYDCKLYRKRIKKNINVTVESSHNISLIEQNEPENSIPVTATIVIPEERKEGEVFDAEVKDKETSTSFVTIAESEPKLNDKDNISKNETGKKKKKKKVKHIISYNESSDSEKEIGKSPEKALSEIQIECETSTKDQSSPKTVDDNIPGNLTTSFTGVDKIISFNLTDSILSVKDVDMCPVEKEKQSNDLNDNSEVSKKSDSNDNSEVSKKSASNDEGEVSKKSASNDEGEVSKKSDSNDNSEVSKKSASNDEGEVSKKSASNDEGEVSKKSDSNDNSEVSKKSDSNDNSEVSKKSDSNDYTEISEKSDTNDNCEVSKKSDSNDNSEVSKKSDSNDNSEISEKSNSNDNVKDTVKENEKVTPCTDNTNITNVFDNLNTNCNNTEKEPTSKRNLDTNETSQSSADSKPFIKCVNISKLLKDGIKDDIKDDIHIVESDSDEELFVKRKKTKADTNKKQHKYNHNQRKPLKAGKKFKSEKHTKTNDDKDYWKLKRNKVNKFKAKQFSINVSRLPLLCQEYLNKHNLKKITQNGSILCKYTEPSDNGNNKDQIASKESIPTTTAIEIAAATSNVKSSLLNDSDSDDNENLKNIAAYIIKSVVNESDKNSCDLPDTNDNVENRSKSKTPDPIKESNENNEIFKSPQNDQIKKCLLNDSTDENSPNKKDKNETESSSPPSKRKHIMESMHAKKMLLTYSSSSDTDDEDLKGALKQIRDYLLKGNSSEDENKEDKTTKAPSESDASSICLKRKRSRSRSVSSHTETSKDKKISESESSTKKTSSQAEDNIDEKSASSSKKMGPSKSNPGSSTQNSDSQDTYDKEIDGLTNLKSLNKKHRRRGSTSTITTQRSSRSSRRMPKPCISEEGFLKAESSSDNASVADSEDGYAEDLPEVSLSGLNGDGISHLAKDDLLDESNSSSSHNKSSSDDKKPETEEGHGKSKSRRKAAISSDSEAGSSRKKVIGVKMSDFEDSEDDSEPKKTKRKKKGSDSDASAGSSMDESKKKRRRIKNVDESDGSGSETETEGRNKHGRKNIRKVMSKNQLEEATKKAAREEKERIARITERQKLYNNLEFDESGKPDEVVLDKVVLDFDPETKEPLIEVDKGLVKKLKPHQANGIKFMWNACFESVKRIKKDKGSGCILAHCMGLGKTLQVVSLTHTLLTHSSLTGVNRVLVVCPLSTVLNWVNEFSIWLKHTDNDYDVDVYELSRFKQNSERSYQLSQWFSGGGVCVLGYEMFRNLSSDSNKKLKKKMMKSFQESLVEPGPDLVVCDEGHLLKNEKTSLSQAMNRVRTLRRIVLTGTPLQNNLKEYYCMVQFVKPNLLGKYNEYLNRFVNPITNGQYTDSTEHDIRIMKRRSHVLHKMLDGAVQRRDYGVLAPFLPPKHEYVLFITLTEVQIKLYQHYLDNYSRRPLAGKSSGFLFPDFQSLQRIWTHPLVLKYNSERYEIMQQKKREREEEDSEGSLADFIDDDSTPDESSTEESSDSLSDVSDDSRKKSKKKKSAKKSKGKDSKVTTRRGTRAHPVEMADEEVVPLETRDLKTENPTEWWMSLVNEDELEDMRHSHKLVLLFDILRQCEAIGDKLLVFSQSLYSLDLIEHFLSKVDDATQEGRVDEKLNGHVGTWSPGLDYFRLDGSTSCENRSIWCKNFNREDNPRARLFLISTRAGGLGINLVAANRVVIFDVSWNPSHDVQSIFRVYRFGQKKPCYIYRFLAMGTMEEKIYERQVTKQAISKRVIDEQQIDRHYAENDLAELYKFEPSPPPREIPPLPKDRLFAEMLKEHEKQIYKYHEHDSLLENKEEETLTEEERKAAWEDFENEKTRPPPAPFNYNTHNGMMQGLFAQQYATIAAMLRKETPNITDSQIRDMQTLLYNSNSAALMGEIYKYAQPAMMNQRMMNPGMVNPGGGGMGVGGSSGLQYEPPWQRQQQMRMQQLMQQQNMGAKYYAGGLGSRDPMAMALQQQRARELMLGERSRPRGRPPGRAAAATLPPSLLGNTTAPDVVNLDSD